MAENSIKPASEISNLRALAARACAAVFAGSSLDDVLERESAHLSSADRALLRAIAYGVMRERSSLEWLLSQLLDKPLRQEPLLLALLLCGLQQLRAMRVPPHAAVAETVAAAAVLDKPWAKGLVNALLRRYQREQAALEAALPLGSDLRLSYPQWLVAAIKQDWPDSWRAVLAAGNEQGPLTLRVNRRLNTRDEYLADLAVAGVAAQAIDSADDAVGLIEATAVDLVPGFGEGRVSVQDASAQLAAELLNIEPGMRVLDACAAPGGKTAHLLERYQLEQLVALDRDGRRLQRVRENLERLGLEATLIAADANATDIWWNGVPFDRILLDAPCSGTGVIRRHPDIKWLRRDTDIRQMAKQQLKLLQALWPLLAPGGQLLYATCSILQAEGADVLRDFLATQADATESAIAADWGEACGIGRRLPPGTHFDGFYYARLHKP
ncbi:MAG: rsmB [Nevskia sp.]|nr:rsmB [Nevskia sp.]